MEAEFDPSLGSQRSASGTTQGTEEGEVDLLRGAVVVDEKNRRELGFREWCWCRLILQTRKRCKMAEERDTWGEAEGEEWKPSPREGRRRWRKKRW